MITSNFGQQKFEKGKLYKVIHINNQEFFFFEAPDILKKNVSYKEDCVVLLLEEPTFYLQKESIPIEFIKVLHDTRLWYITLNALNSTFRLIKL